MMESTADKTSRHQKCKCTRIICKSVVQWSRKV